MSDPQSYTVGWVCALDKEYVAAKAFLDEIHDGPEHVSMHDNNAYTLGTVGKHNVVIAVAPDGEYGTQSAATVARDMMHSFPNVRIGLMVGIAGGVPSAKHDIRLGDVVVSAPRGGKGGVFQYDFGKERQNEGFEQTGFLNQPPPLLRTAVVALRAQYESDGHQLKTAIHNALEKKRRLRNRYGRPEPGTDRLYVSAVAHPLGDERSCPEVCSQDASNLVLRSARTEEDDDPAIHYGLIASANRVMKDAMVRETAAQQEVLCFEMEAAGLMNHFPCLVVRGICDYSDSHKNKEWQGYAAMAAAAYAKDLLSQIAPNKIEAQKPIVQSLLEVQRDVKQVLQKHHSQEHDDILRWFTPIEYYSRQHDLISKRQSGTGRWLLTSNEFRSWVDQSNRTLFCPGIPGAGKTISTAIVIDELYRRFRNNSSVAVAYVYCNFQTQHEQKAIDLLTNLLKQLIWSQDSVPRSIKQLYEKHRKGRTRPLIEEISQALQSIVPNFSRTFIVVDALDECQVKDGERRRFLAELFSLQTKTAINLFVTSRFIPEIESEFDAGIKLEIRANEEDLDRYIDQHMYLLPRFVSRKQELQNDIKTTIIKAVDGMFLLAQLHLDSLIGLPSVKDIRKALDKLPKGSDAYDAAYCAAMNRIEGQVRNSEILAKRVLSWVVCAKRPMKTLELQHALGVEIGERELDHENLPDVEYMVSVCAGLVVVDEESDIVRLVHYTAQEFFNRTQRRWFSDAEENIAEVCVTYLSFDALASGFCHSDEEFETRLQSNPFYDYAARNWGNHLRESNLHPPNMQFVENEAKVAALSQALMAGQRGHHADYSQDVPRAMTGIHLAAWFGLAEIVNSLINKGHASDFQDSFRRTPLAWAAKNGHEEVVKLLLEKGAQLEAKDNDGRTPLALAAENGHEEVVKLLVEKGAEPETKDYDRRRPLVLAAENGHEEVVKLLLEKGAELETRDDDRSTPLLWAARRGHEAVVKLLVEKGARLETSGGSWDRTPLLWAASNGHEMVVKLLAEKGAELEVRDVDDRTPLSSAASQGHEAVVKVLLEKRVELETRDDTGWTPLSWAASFGREAVARILIENGAEVCSASAGGWTPLSLASEGGHEAIVRLLIEKDATVDPRDEDGRTPLWWASEKGHEAVVRLLIKKGATVDPRDEDGRTPLSVASEKGREEIVQLLIEKDAAVDARDKYGRTPLWCGSGGGHEAIVRLLIEKGAAVDPRDKDGRTPLSVASESGHEKVVRLLIEEGAAVDSTDTDGRTPLSWASRNGNEAVVRFLIEEGAAVDSTDTDGRTPLSWASEMRQEAVVRLLIKKCAAES